jgi:acetyl-CoA C-acetyltransferase
MTASIVGWAHTPFGKFDTETVESLVVRVANDALADAGISAADVDEIVLGHFNAGFSPQDFTASLVLQPTRNCASSRRRGSKMPAPPDRRRCIRASGPSPQARPRSCWW